MNNSLKSVKLLALLFYIPLIPFTISCSNEFEDPDPISEEVVAFVRHPTLIWSRADVGNLEKIGDRLYYSNSYNPGFFDLEGNQNQFSMRSFDMKFSHAFSELLSAGVLTDRKSIVVMPNIGYADNFVAYLSPLNIPDLPLEAQLQNGWFETPNFAINDNFLISSWVRNLFSPGMEEMENTFILELNLVNTSNRSYVDPQEPILRKIKLNLEVDGLKRLDLISAFRFQDGWVVSGSIGGIQNSFFITKEGEATPLRSLEERFVILSFIQGPNGELWLTTESELFYSAEGDIYNMASIASSNQFLRIKLIQDRLVAWAGRDNIYEIVNYNDSENIGITELENLGLEGLWVKDVAFFGDQIYVATNGGLFLKDPENFWKSKVNDDQAAEQKIGWSIAE